MGAVEAVVARASWAARGAAAPRRPARNGAVQCPAQYPYACCRRRLGRPFHPDRPDSALASYSGGDDSEVAGAFGSRARPGNALIGWGGAQALPIYPGVGGK